MSRDSSYYHVHYHYAHHADFLEDFNRTPLQPDKILIPPNLEPLNPEDEEDIVPDQHAAFGITRAIHSFKEPVWKDFRLDALMAEPSSDNTSFGAMLRANALR